MMHKSNSKFLTSRVLTSDLDNLSERGKFTVGDIVKSLLFKNGKLDQQYLPSIAISDIFTVATIAERDLLVVETGDFAIVIDTQEQFIYNGTGWILIDSVGAGGGTLNGLSDVNIATPGINNELVYNGSSWVNLNGPSIIQRGIILNLDQDLNTTANVVFDSVTSISNIGAQKAVVFGNHISTVPGSLYYANNNRFYLRDDLGEYELRNNILHNNRNFLDPINQLLGTTNDVEFNSVTTRSLEFEVQSTPVGIFGLYLGLNDEIRILDGVGTSFSTRQLETDRHTHANKTILDQIDQSLNSASSVTFNKVINNSEYVFNTAIGLTPSSLAIYAFPDGTIRVNTGAGEININTLSDNSHIHLNNSFLDNINQNLSSISSPSFINVNASNFLGNGLNLASSQFIARQIILSDTGPVNHYSGIETLTNYLVLHANAQNTSGGIRLSVEDGTARFNVADFSRFQLSLGSIERISRPSGIIYFSKDVPNPTSKLEIDITTDCSLATPGRLICGIQGTASNAALYCSSSSGLTAPFSDFGADFLFPSDSRIKHSIYDVDNANVEERIKSLQIKRYKYKSGSQTEKYGFIAQDLEANPYYNTCISIFGAHTFKNNLNNNLEETIPDLRVVDTNKIIHELILCTQKLINRIEVLEAVLNI